MKNELGAITLEYNKKIRILTFSLNIDVLNDSDSLRRFVLVSQNIEQVKMVYPDFKGEALALINLDPIREYIADIRPSLTVGDISRLHNELMSLLQMRHVVPIEVFQDWGECAYELLSPVNELTRKVCANGINQGLDANAIMQRYNEAQDELEIAPSEAFIKCTKLALEFVESALCLDKPDEEIMPYCLVPAPYCWDRLHDDGREGHRIR